MKDERLSEEALDAIAAEKQRVLDEVEKGFRVDGYRPRPAVRTDFVARHTLRRRRP